MVYLKNRVHIVQWVARIVSLLLLLVVDDQISFAKDLLEGSQDILIETLEGTGKKYIYLAEGILSIAAYIKTKNLLVLMGIIIVAMFLNIVLKFAKGEMGF